jgi:aminoglycoside phosphotransferase family enzyme/predicted kinase
MVTDEAALAAARARVEALLTTLQDRDPQARLIKTHISWVLLAGDLAYKLKKPVRLPFLDFTTLERRRRSCQEELRLNRRLAPSLYLDVVEVQGGPSGARFDGEGEPLDVALRMRRFADGALWSERLAAGELTPAQVDAFAARLADFHCAAPVAAVASGFGSAPSHARIIGRVVTAIDAWQSRAPRPEPGWSALRDWLDGEQARMAPFWPGRLRDGRVRECHGDLHLGNVVQLGEEATAFDAIDFDEELRWIDVIDDLAFLAMDLMAHRRSDLAFRAIDMYLQTSGDFDALPALRFFLVARALVRAQVSALAEAEHIGLGTSCPAARYLELACALARGSDPRLAITHGLPGSGKTFVSRCLLEVTGAIRVRSDVERKRLFGLHAGEASRDRVAGGIYDRSTTARTFARLSAVAYTALKAGWPTIVDAAFLTRFERAEFAALAAAVASPFSIVDCQAAMPLLRQRVSKRQASGGDASEADTLVLERLATTAEPLDDEEAAVALVVDAEQPATVGALARRWLAAT